MENNKTYWASYWRKNKKRISQERRDRYWGDEEYRELRRKESRERYQAKRKLVKREVPKPDMNRSRLRDKVIIMDGETVVIKSIGALAGVLNVTTETVKVWERNGVIPTATMVDSARRRWYSDDYTKTIRSSVVQWKRQGGGVDRLKRLIRAKFKGGKVVYI